MGYISDLVPHPCECCGHVTDVFNLYSDPLGEYDLICTICADNREQHNEEMQAYEYEHKMPDYQKHIR